jgi:hypothetical protein
MDEAQPAGFPIPRWLRVVMASDRAGSAWYIGLGFFFAPVLAVLSPWPAVTAASGPPRVTSRVVPKVR